MQALIYAADSKNHECNFWGYPLPIIPVIDAETREVIRIHEVATGGGNDPHTFAEGDYAKVNIDHMTPSEYVPELLPGGLRRDLKELNVVQPSGPSFNVEDSNVINCDMTVPYADPRPSFHRKQAFDFGDEAWTMPIVGTIRIINSAPYYFFLPDRSARCPIKSIPKIVPVRFYHKDPRLLQRHLEALQNDVSYYSLVDILHEDDVHEIEETLTLCKELLQQHVTSSKGLVVTTVIRGVWTFRNNQKLVKYKTHIDAQTELESAPQQHRRLPLRRLHIMARDDESRILQYQNDDCSIHVRHYLMVPYPGLTTSPPREFPFSKKHLVTVVDGEGYHIYRLDPKYKFEDREACDKFQSTLRERELCGAFEAAEIKVDGRIVARRQMLRFRRRVERDGTLAGEHDEVNLAELQSSVTIPSIRRLSWDIGKRVESNSVDLMPSLRGSRQFHIKFETDQVPIIALDTGAQEGLFEEWSTAVFQAGNHKS
ncbi:copper amine oxidase 1 [Fusarium denticulatum]|uniref:Copper amine oxidase 1 n=1 Tax=Fusarium denticulatum TaxID=48507 RepID=A0A8H5WJT3_9HYPO|nr:copper amine oxidase 1 [Fusarium denticulatum]